jgi:hypothetical protein
MGWALRRERIRYEMEDTGGFDWVASVPDDQPYVDAMEDAETFTDYQAEHEAPGPWRCDDCGQRWPGERRNCGYCGQPRGD